MLPRRPDRHPRAATPRCGQASCFGRAVGGEAKGDFECLEELGVGEEHSSHSVSCRRLLVGWPASGSRPAARGASGGGVRLPHCRPERTRREAGAPEHIGAGGEATDHAVAERVDVEHRQRRQHRVGRRKAPRVGDEPSETQEVLVASARRTSACLWCRRCACSRRRRRARGRGRAGRPVRPVDARRLRRRARPVGGDVAWVDVAEAPPATAAPARPTRRRRASRSTSISASSSSG